MAKIRRVVGQNRYMSAYVGDIPGTVGKTIADITGIMVQAKSDPTSALPEYIKFWDEGDELDYAKANGTFYYELLAGDFGEGKLIPDVVYYFSVALSFELNPDFSTGGVETDNPSRVVFSQDVIQNDNSE